MFRVMLQSFVVIPFFIALTAIAFHAAVLTLISDDDDLLALLDEIRHGTSTTRWQSAYRLSAVLNDPRAVPTDEGFVSAMRATFDATGYEGDPQARHYMTLALGRTGNRSFREPLLAALAHDPAQNRSYIVHALGCLGDVQAVPALIPLAKDEDPQVRLQAVIALGRIGSSPAGDALAEALADTEPNIRWDAAIGLAKLGDARAKPMLLELLDRSYLARFAAVDAAERDHILKTAIRASARIADPEIAARLEHVAEMDPDPKIRELARGRSERPVTRSDVSSSRAVLDGAPQET